MKILFLPENYFPNVSGVPVVVKYLAEGLHAKGHEVTIATKTFNDEPLVDNINGVRVHRFDMHVDWKKSYVGNIDQYIDFVLSFNADVNILECSQCITTDVLLRHLGKLQGKTIFHSHGFSGLDLEMFAFKGDLKHTIGNTYNWLLSKVYFGYTLPKAMPNIDATLCLSEVDNSREFLEKHCRNHYILDNAADDMFFDGHVSANLLSKYTTLENNCYVMSCANYQYIKDQVSIINEYYASESSKNMSLVCIGSQKNSYYEECVRTVETNERKYGHRDVHLLVGVDRSDIPAIEKNASLYLVASRCERYSISIIEAMSQGVPFISTNVGNARVLPGGVTLFDGDKMSDKIDYLLTHKDEYDKYSKAGLEFAYKNCRIDAVVDKLENILKETVNG